MVKEFFVTWGFYWAIPAFYGFEHFTVIFQSMRLAIKIRWKKLLTYCTATPNLENEFIQLIAILNWCLVLLQVPKCFLPVQIFWASPKIWLHLVPLQKLLCQHKNQFYWLQIIFWSGTKFLWLAQYVNKFLVWHTKFGPAQNI